MGVERVLVEKHMVMICPVNDLGDARLFRFGAVIDRDFAAYHFNSKGCLPDVGYPRQMPDLLDEMQICISNDLNRIRISTMISSSISTLKSTPAMYISLI